MCLTRSQLLEEIWGYDFDGETRTGRCTYPDIKTEAWEMQANMIETVRELDTGSVNRKII